MIVKTGKDGSIIAASGNLRELRVIKAWLESQMTLVYGNEMGPIIAGSIPLGEAFNMWNKVAVAEA